MRGLPDGQVMGEAVRVGTVCLGEGLERGYWVGADGSVVDGDWSGGDRGLQWARGLSGSSGQGELLDLSWCSVDRWSWESSSVQFIATTGPGPSSETNSRTGCCAAHRDRSSVRHWDEV
jgi:hypothetical protein